MNDNEEDLIHSYLDGTILPNDFDRLQAILREDAEARRLLRDFAVVEEKLYGEAAVDLTSLPYLAYGRSEIPSSPANSRRRAAVVAAAGLLVGILGTSAVFAFVSPRGRAERPRVSLLQEGFEDPAIQLQPAFPTLAGCWGGVAIESADAELGVTPKSGSRMLRMAPAGEAVFGRTYFIIDLARFSGLRRDSTREIQVQADFQFGDRSKDGRCVLRAATFAQNLQDIDPRWMNELWSETDTQALDHAARGITKAAGDDDWLTATLSISVPKTGRFLVIACFAGAAGGIPSRTYLDEVHVAWEPVPWQ